MIMVEEWYDILVERMSNEKKKTSTRLNKYVCSLALTIPPLSVDDDAVPLTKQEMLSPTDGGSDSVCRVNYNRFQHYPHCRKKASVTIFNNHGRQACRGMVRPW